jgi:hypothetical protein
MAEAVNGPDLHTINNPKSPLIGTLASRSTHSGLTITGNPGNVVLNRMMLLLDPTPAFARAGSAGP